MKLGKNIGRIVDYGVTKTKKGSFQVFVNLLVDGRDSATWYGMPIKNNGEINVFCFTQLAYCGFNAETHSIEDLSRGTESGLLITSEDIEVYARMETDGKGDEILRVNSLGPLGPIKIDVNEAKSLLSAEQSAKLKAIGGKFKPRKPSKAPAADTESDDILNLENIPF